VHFPSLTIALSDTLKVIEVFPNEFDPGLILATYVANARRRSNLRPSCYTLWEYTPHPHQVEILSLMLIWPGPPLPLRTPESFCHMHVRNSLSCFVSASTRNSSRAHHEPARLECDYQVGYTGSRADTHESPTGQSATPYVDRSMGCGYKARDWHTGAASDNSSQRGNPSLLGSRYAQFSSVWRIRLSKESRERSR